MVMKIREIAESEGGGFDVVGEVFSTRKSAEKYVEKLRNGKIRHDWMGLGFFQTWEYVSETRSREWVYAILPGLSGAIENSLFQHLFFKHGRAVGEHGFPYWQLMETGHPFQEFTALDAWIKRSLIPAEGVFGRTVDVGLSVIDFNGSIVDSHSLLTYAESIQGSFAHHGVEASLSGDERDMVLGIGPRQEFGGRIESFFSQR